MLYVWLAPRSLAHPSPSLTPPLRCLPTGRSDFQFVCTVLFFPVLATCAGLILGVALVIDLFQLCFVAPCNLMASADSPDAAKRAVAAKKFRCAYYLFSDQSQIYRPDWTTDEQDLPTMALCLYACCCVRCGPEGSERYACQPDMAVPFMGMPAHTNCCMDWPCTKPPAEWVAAKGRRMVPGTGSLVGVLSPRKCSTPLSPPLTCPPPASRRL
jgi:hypothetical protein